MESISNHGKTYDIAKKNMDVMGFDDEEIEYVEEHDYLIEKVANEPNRYDKYTIRMLINMESY